MASGTINIGWTTGKLTSRIVWSSTGDAASNTSSITAQLQVKRTDSSYTSGKWEIYFLGGTHDNTYFENNSFTPVYDEGTLISSHVSSSWVTLATIKNTAYPHDSNGRAKGIAFYAKIWAPSGTVQEGEFAEYDGREESALALDTIYRKATIISAPNFTDEQNPTITYSNPTGNNATSLQACISLKANEDTIEYRDIPKTGTSYTFVLTDAERDLLRASAANSNSIQAQFFVRTVIGGQTLWDSLSKTFTVVNNEPALVPMVWDQGTVSTKLTGNPYTMIKGYNTIHYETGATAFKGATIVSQSVTCGGVTGTEDSGVLEYVESNEFIFNCTDSRGNKATPLRLTMPMVEYVKLTCNQKIEMELAEADQDTVVGRLTIYGDYFNGSFGAMNNTLRLWVKHTDNEGNEGEWVELTEGLIPTFNDENNTYELSVTIQGLLSDRAYTFQCRAADETGYVDTEPYTVRHKPVFDWGETDFNFNVPIHMNGNQVLRATDTNRVVLSAEGADVFIRPNGSDIDEGQVRFMTDGRIAINGSILADFVTDSNTSGIWTYEKWARGKAVCYGTLTSSHNTAGGATNINNSTTSTVTYYATRQASFPSGLFVSAPLVFVTANDGGTGVATAENDGSNSSSCKVTVWGTQTALNTVNVMAIGKWK